MFEENYPEGLKRVFLIKGTLADLHISFCFSILVCVVFFVVSFVILSRFPASAAAPKMFPMAYNLIKHFLCEETRRKIIVLGSKTTFHHALHHKTQRRAVTCVIGFVGI